MILKLTQKGYNIFQSFLKEAVELHDKNPTGFAPCIKDNCDFVHIHNEVDELGNVTSVEYKGCLGDEIEIDDNHYDNSADLKEFVKQQYLEII